jgi:hypothetical protein
MVVSGHLHSLAAVPPVKQPCYLLFGRPSEHKNRSGGYVGDNIVLPQPGIEPRLLGHVARNLVALPTVEKIREIFGKPFILGN